MQFGIEAYGDIVRAQMIKPLFGKLTNILLQVYIQST